MEGEKQIKENILETYNEVTSWQKNIFMLPRGKSATEFIKELTNLIYLFVNDTKWKRIALLLVHIFIPLLLQKPSSKSKAKDHATYLEKRLKLWKEEKLKGGHGYFLTIFN